MPSTVSLGFERQGVLATSATPYVTPTPGHYRLDNITPTPGAPMFNINDIYHLSNGPHTPDIAVKFHSIVAGAVGMNLNVYAI